MPALLSTFAHINPHISPCDCIQCLSRRRFNVIRKSKTSVATEHRNFHLPKVNVTSICHLAGGITGPGWQEMNAALHHNEFMEHGQVAFVRVQAESQWKSAFADFLLPHAVKTTGNGDAPYLGSIHFQHRGSGAAAAVGKLGWGGGGRLPVHPESCVRHLVNPCCPDGVGPFASTHSLTVPGFWLGLFRRQEDRLTMPATSQDTLNRIIDRIHFQLPS